MGVSALCNVMVENQRALHQIADEIEKMKNENDVITSTLIAHILTGLTYFLLCESKCVVTAQLCGIRGYQQNFFGTEPSLGHVGSLNSFRSLYYEVQMNLTLTIPIHIYYHIIS